MRHALDVKKAVGGWLKNNKTKSKFCSNSTCTERRTIDRRAENNSALTTRYCNIQVAQRCLSFVHNTLGELRILEIQRPEGAVECWAFLCALEVLHSCQTLNVNIDNGQQLDLCSLYTASLWALARDKVN